MSRSSRREEREPTVGPDGATPVGPMTLTGVVKTSKGFAVATAVFDGDSVKVTLAGSQAFRQFVDAQHKRAVVAQALKA